MASSNPEEQMVNHRGARDRNGGGTSGGERRNGGDDGGTATRGGGDRNGGGRTATERRRDEGGDNQRQAVQRTPDRDRYTPPVVVRQSRPTVVNVNNYGGYPYYRPRYYAPAYYHRWLGSYYGWSPISYAPWPLIYGSIGYSNFGFYTAFGTSYPYAPYVPYAPYAPYAGPWQTGGADIGGIRLKMQPRDAQVFVDGHYAGIVDDFDGTFQSLRLEQGGHKIEIHMPGFEDLELDVHVQPGKTITLQETMRQRP